MKRKHWQQRLKERVLWQAVAEIPGNVTAMSPAGVRVPHPSRRGGAAPVPGPVRPGPTERRSLNGRGRGSGPEAPRDAPAPFVRAPAVPPGCPPARTPPSRPPAPRLTAPPPCPAAPSLTAGPPPPPAREQEMDRSTPCAPGAYHPRAEGGCAPRRSLTPIPRPSAAPQGCKRRIIKRKKPEQNQLIFTCPMDHFASFPAVNSEELQPLD